MNEVTQHIHTELVCAYGQRGDVLGQAATAESQPGVEKLPPDPLS
jgi:hypothetical protein